MISQAIPVLQGADSVIQERLSSSGREFWKATQSHLEDFGRTGLRTLCLAFKQALPRILLAADIASDEAASMPTSPASLIGLVS